MIASNSMMAYIGILENLGERQMQVYKAIEENQPVSNKQLTKILMLAVNCITGRTNELKKKGMVIEIKKAPCEITGKLVSYWGVKHKLR